MKRLLLYSEAVALNEPFTALNIRSVKEVNDKKVYGPHDIITTHIESCHEIDRSFYALYAYSEHNQRWVSIADSLSKIELFQLAEMFNVFSKFTLPLTTKFEI